MFKKVRDLIVFSLDCIKKWWFQYLIKYYRYYFIPVIIFWQKKKTNTLIKYYIKGGYVNFINNSAWWSTIKEQFVDKVVILKDWYDKAINFWWYIWDVAINRILYSNIKEIYIIEPQPSLVNIIKSNLENYKEIIQKKKIKVHLIPKAIGVSVWKIDLFIRNEAKLWDAWVLYEQQDNTSKVEIDIEPIQVFNDIIFDYIKMDIEWWEWDIIEEWIKWSIPFKYKEWIIELHFYLSNFEKHRNIKENFLKFLSSKWFLYEKTWLDNKDQIFKALNNQKDKKREVALFIKRENENSNN